jgi:hypothetical protein
MAQFLTQLETKCISSTAAGGRGYWEVTHPLVYQSDVLGKTITVEPGFITDYASVPRLPIIYALLGDIAHESAVVHDWLFHHHEVCDKDTANLVLREAAQVEGIAHWKKMAIYLGVKIGSGKPWEEDGRGDGHTIVDGKIV